MVTMPAANILPVPNRGVGQEKVNRSAGPEGSALLFFIEPQIRY